ncbi:MAG: hypothetical protein UX13_C0022G0003 [Candidatus Woesebacteria bacterium GW2011_GWB1_45_5]|uniref:Uncharacterized protein n=1 Tax=Candidatus Woesebacteria bacterium GW2011_GWB1_45_5 TaxID=1618581 RepID=A0A0G1MPJ4_9BACT|nr:MAG: hypothetical protein UX13_C0022G0003 [Candidatus Woesebacteria bacterium GW2011_GWB1_45_5]
MEGSRHDGEIKRANEALREHLIDVLTQGKFLNYFHLKPARVKNWLDKMAVSDNEIRFSPGYASAGWGHNQTKHPAIEESDVDSSLSNYEHEARHGLHNLKCQTLFEGLNWAKYTMAFRKTVLGDQAFVDQIEKPGGSPLQERMLKKAREFLSKPALSGTEVFENAWVFGALTYQHAYFVDPGMCEAIASYKDRDVTLVVDQVNRWFFTLFVPGTQILEGYANPLWQEHFRSADDMHKALLVKSSEYNKDTYWASK